MLIARWIKHIWLYSCNNNQDKQCSKNHLILEDVPFYFKLHFLFLLFSNYIIEFKPFHLVWVFHFSYHSSSHWYLERVFLNFIYHLYIQCLFFCNIISETWRIQKTSSLVDHLFHSINNTNWQEQRIEASKHRINRIL